MTNIQIFKRLYRDYTKKYLPKILLSIFFSLLLAGSTSAVAYLLDPAINELFIKQTSSLLYVIPFLIIIAFSVKGLSLYLAKVILSSIPCNVDSIFQIEIRENKKNEEIILKVIIDLTLIGPFSYQFKIN